MGKKMHEVGKVYKAIVDEALDTWHPELSQDMLDTMMKYSSFETVEKYAEAKDSTLAAIVGLREAVKDLWNMDLPESLEESILYDVPFSGEEFLILQKFHQRLAEAEEHQLQYILMYMLIEVHDQWVTRSCEQEFFVESRHERQYVYSRTPLIGWEEAQRFLVFVTPIMASLGANVDGVDIERAYRRHSRGFIQQTRLTKDNLRSHLATGREFYPALPEEISELLQKDTEVCRKMATQICQRVPELK